MILLLGRGQAVMPMQSVGIAEEDFEVVTLGVSPTEVTEGIAALVTVKIKNTGEADGTYKIVLKANRIERVSKDIGITSGTTEVINLEFTETYVRTQTLEV